MKIASFTLGICALLISSGCTNIAHANDPTLLIMAEDIDSDVGRHNRISTQILNEISTQLNMKGFDVYDETAITVGTHVQGRSVRDDAELIDIAKSIQRPPIDVVVFFEIYYNLNAKAYQKELRLRTVGRLLSVQDGRRLGNWEAKLPVHRDQTYLLPTRCFSTGNRVNEDCLLEAIGDDARVLAQEVGAIISEKLKARITGAGKAEAFEKNAGLRRDFTLVFDGFTPQRFLDIEEYLILFSGYESHRSVRTSHLYKEILYKSSIGTSKLERNLHKMMEILGQPYVLNFSGNIYNIKAKNISRDQRTNRSSDKYKW